MMQSKLLDEGSAAPVVPLTRSAALETYMAERLENIRRRLPAAARELKAAGVTFVHVNYDGCGDSGQIESVEYLSAERTPVDPASQITLTQGELGELFYDLLEIRHAGWENNDGACGDFEWDLTNDALRHVHHERFTDYDTTEHEGL